MGEIKFIPDEEVKLNRAFVVAWNNRVRGTGGHEEYMTAYNDLREFFIQNYSKTGMPQTPKDPREEERER